MKTQRVVIVVLSLLVLVLAYFALRKKEEAPPATTAEMWHTNTVEKWFTNTVEQWFTNTTATTKTVFQPVTNEVVKEVPAKLSPTEREAAMSGYKFLNAPTLEDRADALYKLGPVAVDVSVDPGSAMLLGENTDDLKKKVELALSSRNIPVAEQSPNHLRLNVDAAWRMSDPRVALVSSRLELKETSSVARQGDIVKFSPVVWSTTATRFIRTINATQGADNCFQEAVDAFCNDYLSAKEREKEIASRIPGIPNDFLSEAR